MNQDKILATISNLDNNWKKCPDSKIVAILSKVGFRKACEGSGISQKEMLELEYLGFLNPQQIAKRLQYLGIENKEDLQFESIGEIWLESWAKLAEEYTQRKEQIRKIQVDNGITALVKEEIDFFGEKINYLCQHFDLTLIESDRPKLQAQKEKVLKFFDRCSKKFSLTIFQSSEMLDDRGQWFSSDTDSIRALFPLYQWCELTSFNYTLIDLTKDTKEIKTELQLALGNGNIYEDLSYKHFFCLNKENKPPNR